MLPRWLWALAGLLCGSAFLYGVAALNVDPGDPGPAPGAANATVHELPGDDAAPWNLLVVSDIQEGFPYLPRILREGAALRPSAVIVLGDVAITHDEEHLALPVRMMRRAPVPAPLFAIPGNHDIKGGEGAEAFVRRFGADRFDFRIGRTRFLGLNNADGVLTDVALAELDRRLGKAGEDGERVVLCVHRNLIDLDEHHGYVEESNRPLLDILLARRVPLVLGGHWHEFRDVTRGATRFVVAPPSGDRSLETGQDLVSWFILRWTGSEFAFDVESFERRNADELEGHFLRMALVHLQPAYRRSPLAGGALLAALAAGTLGAGWLCLPAVARGAKAGRRAGSRNMDN